MPDSPIGNISAVLHELGHALYEQGFPAEADRTPVYDAPSLGAHESQSRFWENQIGHTRAFWDQIEPAMRRHFPEAMTGIDAALLHRAARVVRPSLIRVEADEVTYNLHIVLRFQIELALIRGDLEVADLPAAFADGMQELLGIRPPTDALGAMQDIHWADGLFGYFPTYTLGNLYAAQLAEAAAAELGDIELAVAGGRFADILGFMRERVHRHGALLPTRELMRQATGVELSLGRPDLPPGALLPRRAPEGEATCKPGGGGEAAAPKKGLPGRGAPAARPAVQMRPPPTDSSGDVTPPPAQGPRAPGGGPGRRAGVRRRSAVAAPSVDDLRAERAALAARDAALAARAADSQAALASGRARLDVARVRYLRALDGLERRLRGIYVTGEPSPIIEFITGGDLDESQARLDLLEALGRQDRGLVEAYRGASAELRDAEEAARRRKDRAVAARGRLDVERSLVDRAPGERREGAARGRGRGGPAGRRRRPCWASRSRRRRRRRRRVRRRRRAERRRRGRPRPGRRPSSRGAACPGTRRSTPRAARPIDAEPAPAGPDATRALPGVGAVGPAAGGGPGPPRPCRPSPRSRPGTARASPAPAWPAASPTTPTPSARRHARCGSGRCCGSPTADAW